MGDRIWSLIFHIFILILEFIVENLYLNLDKIKEDSFCVLEFISGKNFFDFLRFVFGKFDKTFQYFYFISYFYFGDFLSNFNFYFSLFEGKILF